MQVMTTLTMLASEPQRPYLDSTLDPNDPAKAFHEIATYIRICADHHKACTVDMHLQSTLRGLKVIDCTRRTLVTRPPGCHYVALSYVWGAEKQSCSLQDQLPQAIEDSLIVTLALGHRYLWVDRFVSARV
jgi:hypothetical protein